MLYSANSYIMPGVAFLYHALYHLFVILLHSLANGVTNCATCSQHFSENSFFNDFLLEKDNFDNVTTLFFDVKHVVVQTPVHLLIPFRTRFAKSN